MDVRNEIKSIIYKKGSSLKKICDDISKIVGPKFNSNNISTKFSRKTIRFDEVQLIAEELGYEIQFVEKKK